MPADTPTRIHLTGDDIRAAAERLKDRIRRSPAISVGEPGAVVGTIASGGNVDLTSRGQL